MTSKINKKSIFLYYLNSEQNLPEEDSSTYKYSTN